MLLGRSHLSSSKGCSDPAWNTASARGLVQAQLEIGVKMLVIG